MIKPSKGRAPIKSRLARGFLLLGRAGQFGCLAGALLGCAAPGTDGATERGAPFGFLIVVEDGEGHPLPGATLETAGAVIGTTSAEGQAEVTLSGTVGGVTPLEVDCGEAYRSPTEPVLLALRRLQGTTQLPVKRIVCPKRVRDLVIAIRSDRGEGVPVVVRGEVLAVTDESGAAHLQVTGEPGSEVRVTLDTSGVPRRLRPANPTASFSVEETDALVVFDQPFDVERPKRRAVVAPRPGPKRL